MVLMGKVLSNLMVDLQVTCLKLEDRGQRILRTLLDMTEEEARDLLHHSGGNVKTAIVMRSLDVDRLTARALLEGADGRVVDVVGELE
jgi:N-acetylmuramic acid 6-phosphate etherase